MEQRIKELLVLAETGDEDILLQIESEFHLMPETREQRHERMVVEADKVLEEYVPEAAEVSESDLDELAKDADF